VRPSSAKERVRLLGQLTVPSRQSRHLLWHPDRMSTEPGGRPPVRGNRASRWRSLLLLERVRAGERFGDPAVVGIRSRPSCGSALLACAFDLDPRRSLAGSSAWNDRRQRRPAVVRSTGTERARLRVAAGGSRSVAPGPAGRRIREAGSSSGQACLGPWRIGWRPRYRWWRCVVCRRTRGCCRPLEWPEPTPSRAPPLLTLRPRRSAPARLRSGRQVRTGSPRSPGGSDSR
jgi:hypothetical protein